MKSGETIFLSEDHSLIYQVMIMMFLASGSIKD